MVSVSDAAAQLSTSPQAAVARSATITAVGRVLSRSTLRTGTRLEHQTSDYDRLGNLTGLTRYLDAAGATNPVQTAWKYDSLGQVLEWQEPEAALQTSRYDNWGELLEVSWNDTSASPSVNKRMLSRFDGLGRVTHREEQNNGHHRFVVGDRLPVRHRRAVFTAGHSHVSAGPNGPRPRRRPVTSRSATTASVTPRRGCTQIRRARSTSRKISPTPTATPWASSCICPTTGTKPNASTTSTTLRGRIKALEFGQTGGYGQTLYEARSTDVFGRIRKATIGGLID